MAKHLSGQNLAIRLRNGDEAAFREVYDMFHRKLFRFCYGFVKDHQQTEEIVQDTFLNFWLYRDKIRDNIPIESLLFTIMRRLLIDSWRRKITLDKFRKQVQLSVPKPINTTEEYTIAKEIDQIYLSAIAQLNEQQKRVFLLSREEGLNYHEIAQRLEISKDTVKYHLTRALVVFRQHLSRHGILYSYCCLIYKFL